MNIEKKFLELTSHTYPHGTEEKLFDKLPENLNKDQFGNLYLQIGDSDVMFTSHLDTATQADCKVNHEIVDEQGVRIIKTDGKSILGADCKAGVVIMLYMIEKCVPGLYYFFLGEEVGCVGSRKLAKLHETEPLKNITKVVSFDRRGTDSIITYQASSRCCSDEFANKLAQELNLNESSFSYKIDPTGVYTDSAQFTKIYQECTNISVGYYSEHTFSEKQDMTHLIKLAEAATKVDWKSLPVKRDKKAIDYLDYFGSYGGYYSDDYYSPRKSTTTPTSNLVKEFIYDSEYSYVTSFTIDRQTGQYKSVEIDKERFNREVEKISSFLICIELEHSNFTWDGVTLTINYNQHEKHTTKVNRNELTEYLPQLDLTKLVSKIDEVELIY